MRLIISIITVVGPLLLGTFLSLANLPLSKKTIWTACGFISFVAILKAFFDWKKERDHEKKEKKEEYARNHYRMKEEKRELREEEELPKDYINGLGDHPELHHNLNKATVLKNKGMFDLAIKEYKECIKHPRVEVSHLTASHVLIGNCYSRIEMVWMSRPNLNLF